jgi:hypothetical protein
MQPQPYIGKFPITEAGLHAALSHMRELYASLKDAEISEYRIPLNTLQKREYSHDLMSGIIRKLGTANALKSRKP